MTDPKNPKSKLGKPARWEVALMVGMGSLMIGFSVWLHVSYQQAKVDHEHKMQQIDLWKESMVDTTVRAKRAFQRLEEYDIIALNLRRPEPDAWKNSIKQMSREWNYKLERRCVELLRVLPAGQVRHEVVGLLQSKTKATFGDDPDAWLHYIIQQRQHDPDPSFCNFKALLYRSICPKFVEFFPEDDLAQVNLSEVLWDGVTTHLVDLGQCVFANQSSCDLKATDLVFGVLSGPCPHAYPEKIARNLTFFTDHSAETGVLAHYDAKENKMMVFEDNPSKRPLSFAVSGFRYHGNILLVDEQTKSLWLATSGLAIVGPMARSKAKLKSLPVESTTWQLWKAAHPDGLVMTSVQSSQFDE